MKASEAMGLEPYNPQTAEDMEQERLGREYRRQEGERERATDRPIGTPASLRAHLSANLDSYLKILLAGLILYGAAVAGQAIKAHYDDRPSVTRRGA